MSMNSEWSFGDLGGVGDVTDLMWPTYRRTTAAQGGDVSAEFQFSGPDALLEEWFYSYLAREFREHYHGETAFLGRVHTMRLAYNRVVLTVSLDWLYNRVACLYTDIVTGDQEVTAWVEDSASIARWGVREYLIRPSDNTIGVAEAEELAEEMLAEFKEPRISRGEIQSKLARGNLQVTAHGYSQALDAQMYQEDSEGTAQASAEVALALAGASLVEAGSIATNTRLVNIQADWQSRLKRLEWIAGRRDASARRYTFGCVGSRLFDYQPVADSPRYHVWVKRQFVQHFDANNLYVPSPLVRPGGYSLVMDLSSPAASEGIWNPALQWDASVQYDRNGATLRGGAWGMQERQASLQMSIVAKWEKF